MATEDVRFRARGSRDCGRLIGGSRSGAARLARDPDAAPSGGTETERGGVEEQGGMENRTLRRGRRGGGEERGVHCWIAAVVGGRFQDNVVETTEGL